MKTKHLTNSAYRCLTFCGWTLHEATNVGDEIIDLRYEGSDFDYSDCCLECQQAVQQEDELIQEMVQG